MEILARVRRLRVIVEEGAAFCCCDVLALVRRRSKHFHDILLLLQLEVRLQNLDRLLVNLLILHHLKLFHLVDETALFGFRDHRVHAVHDQMLLAGLQDKVDSLERDNKGARVTAV